MPQSLSRVLIHIIFSTKNREAFLTDLALRTELHKFIGAVAKECGCQPLQIGGVADHIHSLIALSRTMTLADLIKELKRVSCNWLQQQGGHLSNFHWQAGYGVFSVSESQIDQVTTYIANHEEHRQKITFQEEFRKFLKRYHVEYDERYLWD